MNPMTQNPLKKFQAPAILVLIALCGLFTTARGENPVPALPIREAIDIAEKARSVRESGDKVYIASITLERPTPTSRRQVWTVRWSAPLIANDPMNREIGVEIAMDGSVKRLVKSLRPPASAVHP